MIENRPRLISFAIRKVDYRARRQLDLNEGQTGIRKKGFAQWKASDKMEKGPVKNLVARLKFRRRLGTKLLIAQQNWLVSRLPETTETLLEPLEQVVARVVLCGTCAAIRTDWPMVESEISPGTICDFIDSSVVEFGGPRKTRQKKIDWAFEKNLIVRDGVGKMVIGWRQGLRKVAKSFRSTKSLL